MESSRADVERWVNKTDRPLEDQIDSFVEGLRVAARLVAEREAEQAAQELAWAEQEAQRRAEQEAHRAEQERREHLFDEVEAWQQAERLRRYVGARVAAGGRRRRLGGLGLGSPMTSIQPIAAPTAEDRTLEACGSTCSSGR